MKLNKINYRIGCDIPGCSRIADYSLDFSGIGERFFVCQKCALELKSQLTGIGDNKKNER